MGRAGPAARDDPLSRPASGRPRTVVVTTVFGEAVGGSERILRTFLRHVDRDVVEPVVVFHEGGGLATEVAALGLRTTVLPTGRFREAHRGAAAVGRLAALLRRERPHLALHWLNRAQVYGAPAAVLAGLGSRTAWWQHGLPDGRDPLDRVATRLPAAWVGADSAGAARAQADALRPRRTSVGVLPGIEVPDAVPGPERAGLRRELGVPEDVPVVGIVGRMLRWKGQHLVVEALGRLRDAGVRAHGLFVGGTTHGVEPGYAPAVRARARDLGLEDATTFTGQLPDATRTFAAMDVAVNASSEESFGLVVLEAMAQGTPVVAVRHGGPAEIVRDGIDGRLVDRPDAGALADAIGALLADPVARAAAGAAGRTRVLERFTAERMTRELERLLAADPAAVRRLGRVPG